MGRTSVCERRGASSKNLEEREQVLDFVGVLSCVGVDSLHSDCLFTSSGTVLKNEQKPRC
jgi:hypothetical protein